MTNQNNKLKYSLGRFLTVLCDLMLLNVLWLVCSLPILTIGPSTSALYAVMLKLVREEDQGIIKPFFKAFKDNFTNSFLYSLMLAAFGMVLYSDVVYALSQSGGIRILFLVISGILAAIILTFVSYVFALQARFENTRKGHIKNSFLLAFCSPGKTVLMWLIDAVPVLLVLFLPPIVVAYIGSLFLLFAISAPAYFNAGILRKVFDRFVPDTSNDNGQETE